MTPQAHEAVYAARMSGNLRDKLFFLPHLPPHAVVFDYGCGPGDLGRSLVKIRPDVLVIGYDNHPGRAAAAGAYQDEDEAMSAFRVASRGRVSLMLMSSVAHEIASFCGQDETERVFALAHSFDMFAYRDMGFTESAQLTPDQMKSGIPSWMIESFVSRWGPADNQASVAHLMLKSRYPDNWEAENLENYGAISASAALRLVSESHPRPILNIHEMPYFLAQDMMNRYGRRPNTATHVTILASR